MDDDLPSGAEILAMRHPSELFGASLGDARALRKHWARIARAFRETEPTVFQHARELFEQARDGQDDLPELEPSPEQVARPQVLEWLDSGDYASLASLLEYDPGSISQYARMQDVLMAVIRGLGPDITPRQLSAVEQEFGHDRLALSPVEERSIELAMAESRVVQQVRKDATWPEQVVEMLDTARIPNVEPLVRAVSRVVDELPEEELHSVLSLLQVNHPDALAMISRWATWMQAGNAELVLSQRDVDDLYKAQYVSQWSGRGILIAGSAILGFIVLVATHLAVMSTVGGQQHMTDTLEKIPMAVGAGVFVVAMVSGYLIHERRRETVIQERVSRLFAVARRIGLFPAEVVAWLVAQSQAFGGADHIPHGQDLVDAIEEDPAALYKCWGSGLCARVVAAPDEPAL